MENKLQKAYEEILSVCEKYANKDYLSDSEFEDIRKMRDQAKNHLMIVDWQEKYGINIRHNIRLYEYSYAKVDEYRSFSYFKDAKAEKMSGYGKYISWEDDNKHPKDEWLLVIAFPTGPYIFGSDYLVDLFQEFWQELKTYNPKYCDSHNHYIYFSLEDSKEIFNNFPDILKKYYEKNKADAKNRKIKKMEEELEKLKS